MQLYSDFSDILQRWANFMTSCLLLWMIKASQNRSTLWEQFFSELYCTQEGQKSIELAYIEVGWLSRFNSPLRQYLSIL